MTGCAIDVARDQPIADDATPWEWAADPAANVVWIRPAMGPA
jgi:hypothetical protein